MCCQRVLTPVDIVLHMLRGFAHAVALMLQKTLTTLISRRAGTCMGGNVSCVSIEVVVGTSWVLINTHLACEWETVICLPVLNIVSAPFEAGKRLGEN